MSRVAQFSRLLWPMLALPLAALPPAAWAHIDSVTGQDYRGYLRNDGWGSCCDWHDCRPASQPFMEPDGEKIMDRGSNKFVFDRDKIVKRPSDDGNWHICGNGKTLNCIIAPAESQRDRGPLDHLFGWAAPVHPAPMTLGLAFTRLATGPLCTAEPR